MSHCVTGLQCNQTPLGGCIWMVSCPLSGRWQCALLPQIIMAHPGAQLSSQLQRKEARDRGFTDPPLLPSPGLAQTSSHNHTLGAIFLHSVSQTSHVFPPEQSIHMHTHTPTQTHTHTHTQKHAHQRLSTYAVPYTVWKDHSPGETRQLKWRCKLLCVEC